MGSKGQSSPSTHRHTSTHQAHQGSTGARCSQPEAGFFPRAETAWPPCGTRHTCALPTLPPTHTTCSHMGPYAWSRCCSSQVLSQPCEGRVRRDSVGLLPRPSGSWSGSSSMPQHTWVKCSVEAPTWPPSCQLWPSISFPPDVADSSPGPPPTPLYPVPNLTSCDLHSPGM